MANIKRANTSGLTKAGTAIPDVPDAPTIGTATDVGTSRAFNNGAATVAITSAAATGGTPTSYTVTSSPGGFSASGTSPVTVTGLQSNTAYTFTARGVNATATGAASVASNSITATTVPDTMSAPTASNVGTGRAYNDGAATVSFSAPATGGKAITGYTITSSPGGFTGTGASSPITVAGLASATAYTFTATATNANGTSVASTASGSITATTVPQAPTIGTVTDGGTGTTVSIPYTAGATGGSTITNYQFVSSPATTTQTSTSNPYTFTGLTAGTAYTFTVAAINANGTSAASSASNSVTPTVPSSFESIASTVPSSGASTVVFSSIPQTYKYLQIRYYIKDNYTTVATSRNLSITFNGDTGNNYTFGYIGNADATVVNSGGSPNGSILLASSIVASHSTQTGMYGSGIVDIADYSSTSINKSVKSVSSALWNVESKGNVYLHQGVWNSTAAINSITLTPQSPFAANCVVSLYGIKG